MQLLYLLPEGELLFTSIVCEKKFRSFPYVDNAEGHFGRRQKLPGKDCRIFGNL